MQGTNVFALDTLGILIPSKPKMQLVALAIFSLLLSGCAVSTGQNQEMAFGHVHGIVDLGSGKMLMGTHTGIYSLNSSGEIAGPIGGNDFDAMGITGNSRVQYASGHPGPNTPSELGSPNLGVVQSVNAGKAWSPVAFTGLEDFHVLTVGIKNEIYGLGSSSTFLRVSLDGGNTWANGAPIEAVDLAVTPSGSLFAATPEGVKVSQDNGLSFKVLAGSPALYNLAPSPNGELIGVDVKGTLWRLANSSWEKFGTVNGTVEALLETESGEVVLVDDRGLVMIKGKESKVIYSTSGAH